MQRRRKHPMVQLERGGVTFSGTAESVNFGGAAGEVAFDSITLGASDPGTSGQSGVTPEPSSLVLSAPAFWPRGGSPAEVRQVKLICNSPFNGIPARVPFFYGQTQPGSALGWKQSADDTSRDAFGEI